MHSALISNDADSGTRSDMGRDRGEASRPTGVCDRAKHVRHEGHTTPHCSGRGRHPGPPTGSPWIVGRRSHHPTASGAEVHQTLGLLAEEKLMQRGEPHWAPCSSRCVRAYRSVLRSGDANPWLRFPIAQRGPDFVTQSNVVAEVDGSRDLLPG
jgi:hypothetical protein